MLFEAIEFRHGHHQDSSSRDNLEKKNNILLMWFLLLGNISLQATEMLLVM